MIPITRTAFKIKVEKSEEKLWDAGILTGKDMPVKIGFECVQSLFFILKKISINEMEIVDYNFHEASCCGGIPLDEHGHCTICGDKL